MRRAGGLWARITAFENLLLAARKARRGKRFKPYCCRFHFALEPELLSLRRELIEKTYTPGPCHLFEIREPKRRLISAAPYRDRVVHHALCNVIEPILDKTLIHDTYACRRGKGTHAAADRAQQFARRYRHALKCDVSKYFPSVDHGILKSLLRRTIKDGDALWLIDSIIDGGQTEVGPPWYFHGDELFTPHERRRGIPIGNLTSQVFANVYLAPLDRFVKETLRVRGYVRYVDDFLLFADAKTRLHEALGACHDFLATLRLRMNPHKCRVFPVRDGVDFLGYRIFRQYRRIRSQNLRRLRRRLRALSQGYAAGTVAPARFRASLRGWLAHAQHANSRGLRRDIGRAITLSCAGNSQERCHTTEAHGFRSRP